MLDVLFMGGLIVASLCDFKKRKIPDAITGFLFLTGVAALFWMPQPSIRMRLAGAFIAGLPLFAAAVCRPGAVGGGDVKLMAAGGFFLDCLLSGTVLRLEWRLQGDTVCI